MHIHTQAKYLAALLPFVSEDLTRYYLTGINVRPCPQGGVVLCATDGHTLGAIHDAGGYADGEYVIEFEKDSIFKLALEKAFETRKDVSEDGEERWEYIAQDYGKVVIENGIANIFHPENKNVTGFALRLGVNNIQPKEGGFPAYEKVVRACEYGQAKADHVCLNPLLLAKFARAAQVLCGISSCAVKAFFSNTDTYKGKNGYDHPILIKTAASEFIGQIMPCRSIERDSLKCNYGGPEIPAWIPLYAAPPEKKKGKKSA